MMNEAVMLNRLSCFLRSAVEDPRLASLHLCVYVVLLQWSVEKKEHPLSLFSQEGMRHCKISASSTYHRTIRQLHQYGYIRYIPSYNHFLGSLVYFIPIQTIADPVKQPNQVIYSFGR